MTIATTKIPVNLTFEQVLGVFGPTIEKIRQGAVDRELNRTLPTDEIKELVDLGFGILRVPEEYNGVDASLTTVVELLVEIASADANVAQALRGHFAFVELLRETPDSEFKSHWLTVIGEGALFGNSESEARGAYGDPDTVVEQYENGYRLNGTKYYTTGTYYSDYTWTTALLRPLDGPEELVSLPVDVHAPGVTVVDDWAGFGQRLTASGTTTFADVEVDPRWIVPRSDDPTLVWSYLQLDLLAVLVGSVDAAVNEITARALASTRNAWNPGVERSQDPATTYAIGEARSRVALIKGALLDVTRRVEQVAQAHTPAAFALADAAVTSLWATIPDEAQQITSRVFNAVGGSATLQDRAIDRHWRNVRTVSSNNPVFQAATAVGTWELDGTPTGAYIFEALQQRSQ